MYHVFYIFHKTILPNALSSSRKYSYLPHGSFFHFNPHLLKISIPKGFVKTPLHSAISVFSLHISELLGSSKTFYMWKKIDGSHCYNQFFLSLFFITATYGTKFCYDFCYLISYSNIKYKDD